MQFNYISFYARIQYFGTDKSRWEWHLNDYKQFMTLTGGINKGKNQRSITHVTLQFLKERNTFISIILSPGNMIVTAKTGMELYQMG